MAVKPILKRVEGYFNVILMTTNLMIKILKPVRVVILTTIKSH